jgi:hypothetical protein
MDTATHVNVASEQTVISDIGNYADINDIQALLNVDLAPYPVAGVWYHRYRIEVSETARQYQPSPFLGDSLTATKTLSRF